MAPSESKESKLLSSKAKEEGKIIQKVNCKISELITYKERQDITLTAGTAVHALVTKVQHISKIQVWSKQRCKVKSSHASNFHTLLLFPGW